MLRTKEDRAQEGPGPEAWVVPAFPTWLVINWAERTLWQLVSSAADGRNRLDPSSIRMRTASSTGSPFSPFGSSIICGPLWSGSPSRSSTRTSTTWRCGTCATWWETSLTFWMLSFNSGRVTWSKGSWFTIAGNLLSITSAPNLSWLTWPACCPWIGCYCPNSWPVGIPSWPDGALPVASFDLSNSIASMPSTTCKYYNLIMNGSIL